MKKRFTTPDHIRWNKRRLLIKERKRKKKHVKKAKILARDNSNSSRDYEDILGQSIYAPPDLRLLENTEECLQFFSDLRNRDNVSRYKIFKIVDVSLRAVIEIDYSLICVFSSIIDDLKIRGIDLRTIFPENKKCRDFIKESGLLNKMYNSKGKPFQESEKSKMLFFEKGTGRFTEDDNRRISQVSKDVQMHLTNSIENHHHIRTILLEICGNSVEWSGTENKQWLLGVKYEEERVIFAVTDVGKGILRTLFKRFGKNFEDFISLKKHDKILIRAFNKKYESTSNDSNRNLGLPEIRKSFDKGRIQDLKVITNNVILHFDNHNKSRTIKRGTPWFKGTFYRWVMTKDNVDNTIS